MGKLRGVVLPQIGGREEEVKEAAVMGGAGTGA